MGTALRRPLLGVLAVALLGWSLRACGSAGGDEGGLAGYGTDAYGSVGTTVTGATPTARASARSGYGYALPAPTATPVAGATVETPAVVRVRIVEFRFEPAEVVVAPGTTVEWENGSATTHTVAAKDGAFTSELLAPGDRFRATFQTTGTVEYWCTLHLEMVGRVIVR
ncbi:MAG: plastocyanin/azurin family copper-binding protein [Thermomicrobium sp.]|nr:plastocyanin/azurin family copper-binding protein [Thermomicrobium sp.]